MMATGRRYHGLFCLFSAGGISQSTRVHGGSHPVIRMDTRRNCRSFKCRLVYLNPFKFMFLSVIGTVTV
jgi:hypothetical protein